jgi:peptidyl-tRNA hydrolase, PTH1 family
MIKAVIGLGNPGKQYAATRHNIGRRVLDVLEQEKPAGIFLFTPDAFMNTLGGPVAEFARRKGLPPEALLVISDDFELPLGQLRLRRGGSSGGHNGLKSILEALGTQEVPRLRVGVGPVPEGVDPAQFVLDSFRSAERPAVEETVQRAAQAVQRTLESGIDAAMTEFNVKSKI